ncbi:MAG: alanine--tRNA ligase, partial [Clostridia bacterium]|nr:alanine--tRNA ligase [Clostridia bacterium]
FVLWNQVIGVPKEQITRLGKADNFWEHGSGPCGPCSEIYFDRGIKYGCGKPDCRPGCDCDRYMEIWNNVFSQFNNDGNGNYTELAQKNIDTGMGLERLACVMQGVDNMFEVDTNRRILEKVCEISGKTYGQDPANDVSIRVCTDHIKSAMFMICDGVIPSNEGRGYVLRRIIRRACRHGKLLSVNRPFLAELCRVAMKENASAYPELDAKGDYILKVLSIEEERFDATIDAGLSILSTMIDKAKANGNSELSGEDAFKLYDTFGFPIDLTREIVEESGLSLDHETFLSLMNEQRARARAARGSIGGWASGSASLLDGIAETEFVGYTETECTAKVLAIIANDMLVEEISEGEFSLVLDRTVLYGEGGGQVGDTGTILGKGTALTVDDTKKTEGVYLHLCTLEKGAVRVGDELTLSIDTARRDAIRRNHSACHLLQAALREVLGSHVEQAGSYVDAERCRFDFSHYSAMTTDEIAKVEEIVNRRILLAQTVETSLTDMETARASGAMALFGEKYGKVVRMVKMGDFSTELCGGTHVSSTGNIGLFRILSESSVAAGVRRIEAVTGLGVLKLLSEREALIRETARELKAPSERDLVRRASQLDGQIRELRRSLESAEARLASAKLDSLIGSAVAVGSLRLLTARLDAKPDAARTLCDDIKARYPDMVAVFAAVSDGKLNFVAVCGADAVKAGAHAGNILKVISVIAGGKGGGRPDSAMSGGRDLDKIDEALSAVADLLPKA